MITDRQPRHSGGCQCGAVRYALYAEPANPHICHCRMCQKAFGSFFAPLAAVAPADLVWTRGAPALFRSSPVVERGFCSQCGTPLSFRYVDAKRIAIAIGSLDAPERLRPRAQLGVEARLPWFADLAALPESRTEDDTPPDRLAAIVNYQHPDHDTDAWPIDADH